MITSDTRPDIGPRPSSRQELKMPKTRMRRINLDLPSHQYEAMAKHMAGKGWTMDKGYGKLKGKTFRIAHMGDMKPSELEEILAGVDEFAGA